MRRRESDVHVARVFAAGRGVYGARRVSAALNREGHPCSVGMVADLMRELGLRACQPRAYKRTTIASEKPVPSPDLIGRDFTAERPGTRLVDDITYLKTGEGWLYLATHMVIGWQLAEHMRTSLVVDALNMAVTHGRVEPGAVFHADRGSQYTSAEFNTFCVGRAGSHESGMDRGVLGQRGRRVVLRRVEERDVSPPHVRYPGPRPVRRRRLHRSLLQPATPALNPRLPHPRRSPHHLPAATKRCQTTEKLSKILDAGHYP